MSETGTLFAALRQSSDEAVVDMLERMVRDARMFSIGGRERR